MQRIINNPYRILGVLAGSSNREITRQASNLKKYVAASVELPVDFSFAKLDDFQRTVEAIDNAIERNDTDSQKIENALFWFWKGNDITDEPAFDALKEGNIQTAFDIWEKLIIETKEGGKRIWRKITEKNASAFHNFFVASYLTNENVNVYNAITAQISFLESDYWHNFKAVVTDITFNSSKKELQFLFLNILIAEKAVETGKLVKTIEKVNFIAKADFLKSISKTFTEKIIAQIDISEKKRKESKVNVASIGENLYQQTQADLKQLKEIFGEQNLSYSNVADKVANEILQCSIDYFNDSQEKNVDNDYFDKSLKLAETAKSLVVGNITKTRIEENFKTMNEMKSYCLCFYCNRNMADDNSSYKRTIYKETYRSPWYETQRTVQFQKLKVTTPRCKYCKQIHDSGYGWLVGLPCIFGGIGLVLGLTNWGYWFGCLLGGGVLGLIIGAIIHSIVSSNKAKKAKIKKESAYTEFEPIRKLLNSGWTTSEPTA
jgi:hypothetical protein